jgi:hypothetical protein
LLCHFGVEENACADLDETRSHRRLGAKVGRRRRERRERDILDAASALIFEKGK